MKYLFSHYGIDVLAQRLAALGLDIVHGFDGAAYNRLIREHQLLQPLDLMGLPAAFSLVIGNSRALWEPFRAACMAQPDLQSAAHPLDRYVEQSVVAGLKRLGIQTRCYFSHDTGPGLVSMLHVVEASGVAFVGPAHLAIHPDFGPWFGLRAVIVFAVPYRRQAAESDPRPPHCAQCTAPCVEALTAAQDRSSNGSVEANWRDWVRVREVCPIGVAQRYSESQIRYHYAKDRRQLRLANR